MAHEKQDWKSALRSAKQKGDRQDDTVDPRQQKKLSRIQYKRRKIEKEIKKLLKGDVIKYKDIEKIHDRFGGTH